MLGGYSEQKSPDHESQELLDKHQSDIQGQLGITYGSAKVVSYQTQVVAGTNYKIKAKTDQGHDIEVVVYKQLPHAGGNTSVSQVQMSQ